MLSFWKQSINIKDMLAPPLPMLAHSHSSLNAFPQADTKQAKQRQRLRVGKSPTCSLCLPPLPFYEKDGSIPV
jgi:hypothetical protein